ncbi:Ribosome-releasing factor 2, mitochondrial [Thecaphora frezii]
MLPSTAVGRGYLRAAAAIRSRRPATRAQRSHYLAPTSSSASILARHAALYPSASLAQVRAHSKQIRSFHCSHVHLAGATCAPPDPEQVPTTQLRNISIIAHIDAGKTTLTERLLHLTNALSPPTAGSSKPGISGTPGDVDSGSTVTDFLEQERQRGITIQSAAVGPVWWSPSTLSKPADKDMIGITLVDTPGHIDFGIEVERALRVVDGAVVVLDGVEGVEAQTEMVWKQAARYDVKSLLLFVNKLDRTGASLSRSMRSILASGLHQRPIVLQLPLPPASQGDEAGIGGVLDLLTMHKLTFSGKAGEVVTRTPLAKADAQTALGVEATKARHALVETLASLDDVLLDELFSQPSGSNEEPHALIPAESIKAAIRRQTLQGCVLPVLCGSAAKNIGVQPLLDAVADFLPSPNDKPGVVGSVAAARSGHGSGAAQAGSEAEDGAAAGAEVTIPIDDRRTTLLAFKVVHDKRRGPITFVRAYSGTLQRTTSLFNTASLSRERLSRVLLPFADQYIETNTLRAGQIGVLLGLKDTKTGDTLVDARTASTSGSGESALGGADLKSLRLKRVHVPPPVFSMSIEPRSKSDEAAVLEALAMLVRTDPSLRLDDGASSGTSAGAAAAAAGTGTGQTVLSGMGELHLEIAKDRLENEFNVRASMGGVRVSFRETLADTVPSEGVTVQDVLDRDMGGKKVKVGCTLNVRALDEGDEGDASLGGNRIEVHLAARPGDEGGAPVRRVASAEDERDIEQYLSEAEQQARKRRGGVSKPTQASSAVEDAPASADLGSMDATSLLTSFRAGALAALSRGPLTSNPLTGLHVTISQPQLFGSDLSTPSAISMLVTQLVRRALWPLPPSPSAAPAVGDARASIALTVLMEPVMHVRLSIAEKDLGKVVSDLTTEQDGTVLDVEHSADADSPAPLAAAAAVGAWGEGGEEVYIPPESLEVGSLNDLAGQETRGKGGITVIHASVPLARLVRYSTRLRALTGGSGSFDMQLSGFMKVSKARQAEILEELGR